MAVCRDKDTGLSPLRSSSTTDAGGEAVDTSVYFKYLAVVALSAVIDPYQEDHKGIGGTPRCGP